MSRISLANTHVIDVYILIVSYCPLLVLLYLGFKEYWIFLSEFLWLLMLFSVISSVFLYQLPTKWYLAGTSQIPHSRIGTDLNYDAATDVCDVLYEMLPSFILILHILLCDGQSPILTPWLLLNNVKIWFIYSTKHTCINNKNVRWKNYCIVCSVCRTGCILCFLSCIWRLPDRLPSQVWVATSKLIKMKSYGKPSLYLYFWCSKKLLVFYQCITPKPDLLSRVYLFSIHSCISFHLLISVGSILPNSNRDLLTIPHITQDIRESTKHYTLRGLLLQLHPNYESTVLFTEMLLNGYRARLIKPIVVKLLTTTTLNC